MKILAHLSVLVFVALAPKLMADQSENDHLASEGEKMNMWSSFLPSQLMFGGVTYGFSQTVAENNFARHIKDYQQCTEEAKSLGSGDSRLVFVRSKQTRVEISLAYCIMAVAQFASSTKELDALLKEADQVLATRSLPDAVSTPFSQMLGIASQSFVDKKGNATPIQDVTELGCRDFKALILQARMQIAARVKSK